MTSPSREFPPAPPSSGRNDARLTADEVRERLAEMRAKLDGTDTEEETP